MLKYGSLGQPIDTRAVLPPPTVRFGSIQRVIDIDRARRFHRPPRKPSHLRRQSSHTITTTPLILQSQHSKRYYSRHHRQRQHGQHDRRRSRKYCIRHHTCQRPQQRPRNRSSCSRASPRESQQAELHDLVPPLRHLLAVDFLLPPTRRSPPPLLFQPPFRLLPARRPAPATRTAHTRPSDHQPGQPPLPIHGALRRSHPPPVRTRSREARERNSAASHQGIGAESERPTGLAIEF